MTVQDYSAFADMERNGWSDAARASGYVDLFAAASDQAIESLLDAAGVRPNLKSLDLCCGQGNVSAGISHKTFIGRWVLGFTSTPIIVALGTRWRSN